MPVAARYPVITFSVIVLALGGLVMLAGLGRDATPFGLVLVIPVAAILSAWLVGGGEMVRGLFQRITRWRVPARWYAAAIGIPIATALLIDAVAIGLGVSDLGTILGAINANALIVPLVVFLPGLLEEFAWRGFGVDMMLRRGHSFAAAALGIGVVFTAIHMPLYLPGGLYDNLPVWPGVLFLLGSSVLLAWIYVGSGRSSLLAGICHAGLNATVPLRWGLDDTWEWIARGVLFAVIGLLILVVVMRSRRLAPMEDGVPAAAEA